MFVCFLKLPAFHICWVTEISIFILEDNITVFLQHTFNGHAEVVVAEQETGVGGFDRVKLKLWEHWGFTDQLYTSLLDVGRWNHQLDSSSKARRLQDGRCAVHLPLLCLTKDHFIVLRTSSGVVLGSPLSRVTVTVDPELPVERL